MNEEKGAEKGKEIVVRRVDCQWQITELLSGCREIDVAGGEKPAVLVLQEATGTLLIPIERLAPD